jgi:hypothetical protein
VLVKTNSARMWKRVAEEMTSVLPQKSLEIVKICNTSNLTVCEFLNRYPCSFLLSAELGLKDACFPSARVAILYNQVDLSVHIKYKFRCCCSKYTNISPKA